MRLITSIVFLFAALCFQYPTWATSDDMLNLSERISIAARRSPFFVAIDYHEFQHPQDGETKTSLIHFSTQGNRNELLFRVAVSDKKFAFALIRPSQSASLTLDFLEAEFEFANGLMENFETLTQLPPESLSKDPSTGLKNGFWIEMESPILRSKEFNELLSTWLGRYQSPCELQLIR